MNSPLALCALLGLAACSSSSGTPMCAGTTSTLTVSVVNDTNEPMNICNAKVVATGPSTVTLTPSGGSSTSSCDYQGTVGSGEYTITATAAGYETMTAHQIIQAGCNATVAVDVIPSP